MASIFAPTLAAHARRLADPDPVAGSQYGLAAAMNELWIVIGGPCGHAVYAFSRHGADAPRNLADPAPTRGDIFGRARALRGDGLVVGAPTDSAAGTHAHDAGEAWPFDKPQGGSSG